MTMYPPHVPNLSVIETPMENQDCFNSRVCLTDVLDLAQVEYGSIGNRSVLVNARVLYFEYVKSQALSMNGTMTDLHFLQRSFPDFSEIIRVFADFTTNGGKKGFLEFSTQTAARTALQHANPHGYKLSWSQREIIFPPLQITPFDILPIFEHLNRCKISLAKSTTSTGFTNHPRLALIQKFPYNSEYLVALVLCFSGAFNSENFSHEYIFEEILWKLKKL